MSLIDRQDLAEIAQPDYPGERLVAFGNPVLAADRVRTHEVLLAATEQLFALIIARVRVGGWPGADPIGVAVGQVISTHKVAKHLRVTITDTSLDVQRRQDRIAVDPCPVIDIPCPHRGDGGERERSVHLGYA